MSENNGFSGAQLLFAFLGGAAAGGVVALLTAPQSGAKTRADIRNRARATYDDASRMPKTLAGAVGAAREAFNGSFARSNDHDGA